MSKYVAGSYNGYNLFLNDGNLCAWYIRDDFNYVYDGSGCTFRLAGYNDGQWHHAVYVVDASGARLYVDGAEKGSLAWTGVAGAVSTTEAVRVGYYPEAFGGAEYFEGAADDVRVYQDALTPAEVADLYNNVGVLYVDNLGSCAGGLPCYRTIMDAINAAEAGDTIEVFPGVYHEMVTFSSKSNIVLRAHQPELRPVIVAPPGGNSAVTLASSDGIQIMNFVLEAPEGAGVSSGGGPASGFVIEGNLMKTLRGIVLFGGGSVRNNTLLGGSMDFSRCADCLIEGNQTSGGGISIGGSLANPGGNVIRDNVLQGGISIAAEGVSNNSVQSNRIYGGGIGITAGRNGSGNVIKGNVVRGGGAISLSVGWTLSSNTIESNFVSGSAGDGIVVYVRDTGANLISKNTSVENAGCDVNDTSGPNANNVWEENRFGTKCGAVD